jgi:hypothetical protein
MSILKEVLNFQSLLEFVENGKSTILTLSTSNGWTKVSDTLIPSSKMSFQGEQ